jgi:hypothetical protein
VSNASSALDCTAFLHQVRLGQEQDPVRFSKPTSSVPPIVLAPPALVIEPIVLPVPPPKLKVLAPPALVTESIVLPVPPLPSSSSTAFEDTLSSQDTCTIQDLHRLITQFTAEILVPFTTSPLNPNATKAMTDPQTKSNQATYTQQSPNSFFKLYNNQPHRRKPQRLLLPTLVPIDPSILPTSVALLLLLPSAADRNSITLSTEPHESLINQLLLSPWIDVPNFPIAALKEEPRFHLAHYYCPRLVTTNSADNQQSLINRPNCNDVSPMPPFAHTIVTEATKAYSKAPNSLVLNSSHPPAAESVPSYHKIHYPANDVFDPGICFLKLLFPHFRKTFNASTNT